MNRNKIFHHWFKHWQNLQSYTHMPDAMNRRWIHKSWYLMMFDSKPTIHNHYSFLFVIARPFNGCSMTLALLFLVLLYSMTQTPMWAFNINTPFSPLFSLLFFCFDAWCRTDDSRSLPVHVCHDKISSIVVRWLLLCSSSFCSVFWLKLLCRPAA